MALLMACEHLCTLASRPPRTLRLISFATFACDGSARAPIAERGDDGDPYGWMARHSRRKALRSLIRAENAYARSVLDSEAMRARTNDWMRRIHEFTLRENDEAAEELGEQLGEHVYYIKYRAGWPLYCRKKGKQEEVILDQQAISDSNKGARVVVGILKVSLCANWLAYTVEIGEGSVDGVEHYECRVRHLPARQEYRLAAARVVNVEWAGTMAAPALLYTVPDELHRPHELYVHTPIGSPHALGDKLLFTEIDSRFFLDIVRTKDLQFVIINSHSKTASELHVISTENILTDSPACLLPRTPGVEYFVEHWRNFWLLITNRPFADSSNEHHEANYRVYAIPATSMAERSSWQLIIPPDADAHIDDADIFANHLVLYERRNASPQVRVIDLENSSDQVTVRRNEVVIPPSSSEICAVEPGINVNYEAPAFRFTYSTPTSPPRTFTFTFSSGDLALVSERTPYHPSQLLHLQNASECQRVYVPSSDGTRIPLSLVYQKSSRPQRALIVSYGSYGHSLSTDYSPEYAAMISSGWTVAFAHIRGGGEYGKRWHHAARGVHRRRAVEDLIACAKYIADAGFGRRGSIAASAASAGGLILAAALNESGSTCIDAAVLRVPFVDVLSAMQDPSLPLTEHEHDEFGDVRDPDTSLAVAEIDPIRNVTLQRYPHLLLTVSTRDARVPVWGPLKYMAQLRYAENRRRRQHPREGAPLQLCVVTESGHFGEEGQDGQLRDRATEIAFLEHCLNHKQDL